MYWVRGLAPDKDVCSEGRHLAFPGVRQRAGSFGKAPIGAREGKMPSPEGPSIATFYGAGS